MSYAPPGPPQGPYSQPGPAQQQGPGQQPKSRRGLLWAGIGCAVLLIVGLLIAVLAGVIFLFVRGGGSDSPRSTEPSTAATETFTGDTFTVQYPADWEKVPDDGNESTTGEVLEIAPSDHSAKAKIYRYHPSQTTDVATECAAQSAFLPMSFDGDDKATQEETDQADGRDAYHYSLSGSSSGLMEGEQGQDMHVDMWCMKDDENVVQLVVTTIGSTDPGPQAQQMLESWSWTSQD